MNDPIHLHGRARDLGILLADGQMSYESVRHVCSLWAANQNHVNRSGLQCRLVWAATDAARNHIRQRTNAEMAIRWAVRPLLQANASAAAIEEAAGKAGGHVLPWDEIRPILAEEWQRAHSRQRAR